MEVMDFDGKEEYNPGDPRCEIDDASERNTIDTASKTTKRKIMIAISFIAAIAAAACVPETSGDNNGVPIDEIGQSDGGGFDDTDDDIDQNPKPFNGNSQGCQVPSVGAPRFRKVEANASGFSHSQTYSADQIALSGPSVCALDCDGDSDLDVYFPSDSGGMLYRNNQNGRFSRISDAGIRGPRIATGCLSFDADADFDPDLLAIGIDEIRLYENIGDCHFEDATENRGIDPDEYLNVMFHATAGDPDEDGDIDFAVATLSSTDKTNPSLPHDLHFENIGDGFRDVSSGGRRLSSQGNVNYMNLFADFDGDGREDYYIGNDIGGPEAYIPNNIMLGDGEGGFLRDAARELGLDFSDSPERDGGDDMGVDFEDVTLNGCPDQVITSFILRHNILFACEIEKDGKRRYRDISMESGFESLLGNGWGTVFFDADFDGDRDVLFAADQPNEQNRLYINENGRFIPRRIYDNDTVFDTDANFGLAAFHDPDGSMNVILTTKNNPPQFFRQENPAGNFVRFAVRGDGETVNPDALGAVIRAEGPGGCVISDLIKAGASFGGSAQENLAVLGIGDLEEVEAQIEWPDRLVEDLGTIQAGETREVRRQ